MSILNKQEILHEFEKCITDPSYMIESYFQTFDKTNEGYVPFKLFPKQREIINAYENNKNNIVTKPRQAGVSTTTAAYYACKVALADRKNPEAILILANKQDLAQEFLSKVKEFLDQVPRWMWGKDYYGNEEKNKKTIFITDSKKEIKLPNGSRVKAVATSKDALRGFTPTRLVMDEAAFIDNGDIVFGAAQTSMGTGGSCTLISTPNGQDPLYYRTYDLAKIGRNNFNIVEMKWYEDPRYNKNLRWLKGDNEPIYEVDYTVESYKKMLSDGYKPSSDWYDDMCKSMNYDTKQIAQELDVSFLGSGGNVVADQYIELQEKENVKEPIFIDNKYYDGNSGQVFIWKHPEQGHKYIATVDVSRGDGEDFSTINILDFDTMEQVLEYEGKIQPDLLANIVLEFCTPYNAYLVIDNIGVGATTVFKVIELGYQNLHYDQIGFGILKQKQEKLSKYSKNNGKLVPGFNISAIRTQLISNMEEKIRLGVVKIRSKRIISQLRTFVYRNGRADHLKGYNDDCLIALGMGLFIAEYHFKELSRLEKIDHAILNAWTVGIYKKENLEEEVVNKMMEDRKKVSNKYKLMPLGNLKSNTHIKRDVNNNDWLFKGLRR